MPQPTLRAVLALFAPLCLCGPAAIASSNQTYMLHENLHVGQTVTYQMKYDNATNSTAATDGKKTVTDTDRIEQWKVTLTMLAVEDGSARRARAEVSADSTDTTRTGKDKPETVPCPFAGKSVIITRDDDNNLSNSFPGDASPEDMNDLSNFLAPDEAFYPDHPVAVGDVWDNSNKVRVYCVGPTDLLASRCRLDWVKTIDGRQMAHVSNVGAMVLHEEGDVEEDVKFTATFMVDIAAGMIVKADQTGSSVYSTPPTAATQVTGGTHFSFYSQVVPQTAGATTRP
ncbi:MAG TPA: hypothetical protein VMD30_11350 [Tepidisphaeraceae bacterium]|nr:hypothetical protein [Tepidisphaeraceae bacterium]